VLILVHEYLTEPAGSAGNGAFTLSHLCVQNVKTVSTDAAHVPTWDALTAFLNTF